MGVNSDHPMTPIAQFVNTFKNCGNIHNIELITLAIYLSAYEKETEREQERDKREVNASFC